MQVTLSFDNGPHPDVTPTVLDILSAHDLRAWFFVVGRELAAPQGRQLTAATIAQGHRVGNHSYTHSTPLGELRDGQMAIAEVQQTQTLLDTLVEGGDSWFRPFGGGGVLSRSLFNRSVVR